jgi:purine-binding chemotaxis protein CheW
MRKTETERDSKMVLLSTFFVGDSLCALDAAGVQEVIRIDSLTRIRNAPEQVAGVINLRGRIVTLLDLGIVLGFGPSRLTNDSRVFVIEDRNEFLGLIVDKVGEVTEMPPERVDSLPVNMPATRARCFRGVYRSGGKVIALLNPGEVLN